MLSKKDVKKFLKGQFHPLPPLYQVPKNMLLDSTDSGIFFGDFDGFGYVGMPEGTDGNVVIIGGNGSGKTAGVIKPTMETWQQPIFAYDVKGDISDWYQQFCETSYARGETPRPYLVFDPLDEDGIGYDPFVFLEQDGEENLVTNIWDLVYTLIPIDHEAREPFWHQSEQAILAAALLYFYQMGLGFSQAIAIIAASTVSDLCKQMASTDNATIRMMIGQTATMKEETIAAIDRGLCNHLQLFATDPFISNAFCGEREGAQCFSWDDLDGSNIFLKVPADKLKIWGAAINLMTTQLIRHLERRSEKYSGEGANTEQTLLLLDEFPRIGKVQCIVDAMATLRSKGVNICLAIQSLAQLDAVYGVAQRRVIMDNCQFQMVLRANDGETQRLLSDLIGTDIVCRRSAGVSYDEFMRPTGYQLQMSESREHIIQPHELATLNDVLVISPYGTFRVEKYQQYEHLRFEDSNALKKYDIFKPITLTEVKRK